MAPLRDAWATAYFNDLDLLRSGRRGSWNQLEQSSSWPACNTAAEPWIRKSNNNQEDHDGRA